MSKKQYYGRRAMNTGSELTDAEYARVGYPWLNWYVDRGRAHLSGDFRKQLRSLSWRRVF